MTLQVDIRMALKALKIISGVSKAAVNMGHTLKVRELLAQEPLQSTLVHCARWSRTAPCDIQGQAAPGTIPDIVVTIQRLSKQLIELGMSLGSSS